MEKWKCPKCENEEYEKDQFQATGGDFAKIFDVQNKKFITISCTKCGYTELYKTGTTERCAGIRKLLILYVVDLVKTGNSIMNKIFLKNYLIMLLHMTHLEEK